MMAETAVNAPVDVWSNLDAIRTRLAGVHRLFLFTDFDGTLAPIASVPALATLPQGTKAALKALAAAGVVTAVVSGRAVDDLQRLLGLPLIYAGNHGLEIRGAGLEYIDPAARPLRYELLAICNTLRALLEPFPGALVECKRLSAGVHYRLVDRRDVPAVTAIVKTAVEEHPEFRAAPGKKVLEIGPDLPWNKGSAVGWILERFQADATSAICIGDDSPDEDMFRELDAGITVRVGADTASSPQYTIAQGDVLRFLEFIGGAAGGRRRKDEVTYGGIRP